MADWGRKDGASEGEENIRADVGGDELRSMPNKRFVAEHQRLIDAETKRYDPPGGGGRTATFPYTCDNRLNGGGPRWPSDRAELPPRQRVSM